MLPLIMLAAQLLAKQKQEQEDRNNEIAKIASQRASSLGAPTYGVEAAAFNQGQNSKTWADPKLLAGIYGDATSGPPSDPGNGNPGSDGLVNPWQSGSGIENFDDRYGLRSKL